MAKKCIFATQLEQAVEILDKVIDKRYRSKQKGQQRRHWMRYNKRTKLLEEARTITMNTIADLYTEFDKPVKPISK